MDGTDYRRFLIIKAWEREMLRFQDEINKQCNQSSWTDTQAEYQYA